VQKDQQHTGKERRGGKDTTCGKGYRGKRLLRLKKKENKPTTRAHPAVGDDEGKKLALLDQVRELRASQERKALARDPYFIKTAGKFSARKAPLIMKASLKCGGGWGKPLPSWTARRVRKSNWGRRKGTK